MTFHVYVRDSFKTESGDRKFTNPKLFTVSCKYHESPILAAVMQSRSFGHKSPVVFNGDNYHRFTSS